jgi:hypothetical protein
MLNGVKIYNYLIQCIKYKDQKGTMLFLIG